MAITFIILFAVATLTLLRLHRAYYFLPARELKARAREGDKTAASLWRARAYSDSLNLVLWLGIGLAAAAFFWQVAQALPAAAAVGAGVLFVWVAVLWQVIARVPSAMTAQVAAVVAPYLAWPLGYIHIVAEPVARIISRYLPVSGHTGLYDVDDLLDLLQDQYHQPDNRIDRAALFVAAQALTFGHRSVQEVMTPGHKVLQVSVDDTIGPVLMNELHASGQSYFPVYEGKKGRIVGSLSLRDLVDKKSAGPVKDHMHAGIHTLQEDQPLTDTLEEILQPGRHMLTVVDDRNKYVGIVTAQDILHQIIGQPVPDELEEYHEPEPEPEPAVTQETDRNITS